MRGVGGAGRDQAHVKHAASLPGISLVDGIAFAVDLERAIEVSAFIHRAPVAIFHATAPREHAAVGIARLKFQPHIVSIHRARWKEGADLARSHHGTHADRGPRLESNSRRPDRRSEFTHFADHRGASLFSFFAD